MKNFSRGPGMGQLDHPELLDAEMRIIKAAKANGLHIGIGTGTSVEMPEWALTGYSVATALNI